jgi:hypothetical protein
MDFTRTRWSRFLLVNRWPQFLARAITLAGFIFTILVGLFGTPVGGRNFAIIFVWIAWWTALKLLFIPFGGRAWCSVCPIPMPGEWLQRGGLVRAGRPLGLGLRWPTKLRHAWFQVGGFAIMGLFSAVLLTQPRATAWILLGLIVFALGLSLVFERRVFCRHFCPIGSFIGKYALLAPVEVRARDAEICRHHVEKTCYTDGNGGTGCPWMLFPAAVNENLHCGMCMECVRVCPHDNMAVRTRPFGADLASAAPRRLDQVWVSLMFLACAPIYAAVMLGPWGTLKDAAYLIGSPAWFLYALVFLVTTLAVVPGLYWVAVWSGWRWGGARGSLRKQFLAQGYALAPLGFGAWLAFTMAFAFGTLAYVWRVLSDPFGWGWNLFGTATWPWQPYLVGITPVLQVLALVGGLVWTALWVWRTAAKPSPRETARQVTPVIAFCAAFTALMLWLLL